MSQSRLWVWIFSAGAVAFCLGWSSQPSQAVIFGQTEVDQSKFVAIAVPRASGYYTLLVLEQRSDKKPCWRESGSSPTRVEPLLLNFNFTGICGRSTDSNGYSIRAAGQDLGMSYQLSLQKQKNDVLLLGVPAGSGKGKVMELGRTNGVRSGFLKIELKSGWRFTKRVYSGKTLGHVYFSRDTAPTYQVASRPEQKTSAKKVVYNPDPPPASPDRASGQHSYLVMVIAPTPTQQAKIRARQPSSFRTSHQGQSVMQVGTFSDRTKAESLKTALTRQGFKVLLVTKAAGPVSSLGGATIPVESNVLNPDRIAVPNKKLPIGHIRGAKGVYAAGKRFPKLSKLPPPPTLGIQAR
jgi:N-acetylmuramoyl-L-alanine amidase